MIVMKFGGTSVGDAVRIRTVIELVRSRLERQPVVVVSAHAGVTNELESLALRALERPVDIAALRQRHDAILAELDLPADLVKEELDDLSSLLRGISLVGELTPRSRDCILSFGERCSARVVAAALTRAGIPSRACDAYEIGLVTDSRFGSANPLESSYAPLGRRLRRLREVPVVTGFIGRDRQGNITTLGRGGSDYTAAILGRAVDAEEIQIWTDVDGVMTADPKMCPSATSLKVMSFAEASELAYYGARVVHPSTMIPAVRASIPVRVLNTYKPQHPGTVILAEAPGRGRAVKSIAHRGHLALITVTSTRMLLQHGFMAKLFDVFGRHEIVIDMVATSEVTVSLTTDAQHDLKPVIAELREFAEAEVETGLGVVCLVGEGIRRSAAVVPDLFDVLRRARVKQRMVSFAASNVNVSVLMSENDVRRAVRALHRHFFEG